MSWFIRITLIWGTLFGIGRTVEAIVLFDATVGTTPDAQGWLFATDPPIGAASHQSIVGGLLLLNTRDDISEQAGYFSKVPFLSFQHPDHPVIDLSLASYSITFGMRQVAGSNLPDTDPLAVGEHNRGGFALIAISEDLSGIELQFQTDQIVALDDENTAFPIGESQAFDSTAALYDFELKLSQTGYELLVDDLLLLEESLRNYASIAPDPPKDFPYTTPSFFFWGDNTGRGEALSEVTQFEVNVVPEPVSWRLAVTSFFLIGVCHRCWGRTC